MNDQHVLQLVRAQRDVACATLTAAIIAAAGRPFSINEAMSIQRDVFLANYGGEMAGHSVYQDWAKTRDERLGKVYGPTG
jgi:hypothetical protein